MLCFFIQYRPATNKDIFWDIYYGIILVSVEAYHP